MEFKERYPLFRMKNTGKPQKRENDTDNRRIHL